MRSRWKEPSTWAGAGLVITGIGQIAKINEAPAIAEAVQSAASRIASGDWLGVAMAAFGALSVILREESRN